MGYSFAQRVSIIVYVAAALPQVLCLSSVARKRTSIPLSAQVEAADVDTQATETVLAAESGARKSLRADVSLTETSSGLLPSPTLNSTELSCTLKQAVNFGNVTLLGTNDTLKDLQDRGQIPSRWKTCAAVSSSGVVSLDRHGKEIDSAELVIHFNTAPMDGYEDMVGSRDDVRFVNNQFGKLMLEDSQDLKVNLNTTYIVAMGADEKAAMENLEELVEKHPGMRVFVAQVPVENSVSDVFRYIYDDEWFHEQGVSYEPTTGGIGMLIAMASCDEIRAYGMAESERARTAPYHYYDGEGTIASTQSYHKSFTAEKELWRRLSVTQIADIDATDVAVIPGFSQYDCAGFVEQKWHSGAVGMPKSGNLLSACIIACIAAFWGLSKP